MPVDISGILNAFSEVLKEAPEAGYSPHVESWQQFLDRRVREDFDRIFDTESIDVDDSVVEEAVAEVDGLPNVIGTMLQPEAKPCVSPSIPTDGTAPTVRKLRIRKE